MTMKPDETLDMYLYRLSMQALSMKRLRRKRKEAERCVDCGMRVMTGHTRCFFHRAKQREYNANYLEMKKELGL